MNFALLTLRCKAAWYVLWGKTPFRFTDKSGVIVFDEDGHMHCVVPHGSLNAWVTFGSPTGRIMLIKELFQATEAGAKARSILREELADNGSPSTIVSPPSAVVH